MQIIYEINGTVAQYDGFHPPFTFISSTNEIHLVFYSDEIISAIGFTAVFYIYSPSGKQ